MVSRARGPYAVLAAVVMVAGILLLAIPAWSQDSQSKKDSGRSGDAKTENSSSQQKSEASNKDSNRGGDAKTEKSSDQKSKASSTDKKNDNNSNKKTEVV